MLLGLGLMLTLGGQIPAPPPAPFRVVPDFGSADVPARTGYVGLGGIVALEPDAPFTVLAVRPLRLDPGLELLAVRAFFWGRGPTASGYSMFPVYPASDCAREITGYGPSYPVEGLRLRPGDPVRFVYYVRATRLGMLVVSGFRIRYRTADGRVGAVLGTDRELVMDVRAPSEPGRRVGVCRTGFAVRHPGYPE